MLDPNLTSSNSSNRESRNTTVETPQGGENILSVMWRFKWLLLAFAVTGFSSGYWVYTQKPTTYRATTQLLFKSDAPLTLDASTGSMRGGVPSGGLMQSLITSNQIVDLVASSSELSSIPSLQGKNQKQLALLIRNGIQFQPLTDEQDSRDRMIAMLNFDGRDPQVCVEVVRIMSGAISEYFDNERNTTISEFSKLLSKARTNFLNQQAELEEEYQMFRREEKLEYDVEGRAINPFREQQFLLQTNLVELQQRQRELSSELRFARSTVERHTDPVLAAQIIGQLSGVVDEFSEIRMASRSVDVMTNDLVLQQIEVEKSLVPLEVRREQLEIAYGASHPEVRNITMQIESSQEKLTELSRQVKERRDELNAKNQTTDLASEADRIRVRRAKEAVDAYVKGLEERLSVIAEDLNDLQVMIEDQKEKADNLKVAEDKNASLLRQIDGIKGIGDQLESQIAAIDLANIKGGIIVDPLLDSGQAYVTGPDLGKDLILFGLAGLGLSALLAVLFEYTAKMFRSAEEVQRELRAPVLSHIPLDEGKLQPSKSVVDPEVAKLDEKLSVVHRPYSPSAEAIRGVRTSLLFDHRKHGSKVFQVTSPLPGDGKSTLTANLGCSVAQSGKRTLLIDLDLRSPRLSLRFNLEAADGLTNVLNGEIAPAEAVAQTPIENLDILPCGPLPANPAEALSLAEMADIFAWAREHYDFIIVDTPPLLMVSDPAVVTTYVDAAMLVMRIRRRSKPNAKEAMSMLRASGARVMGVVVNEIEEMGGASYRTSASGTYQSAGYGYGDKYRRRYQKEANVEDTYVVKGHLTGPPNGVARPAGEPLGHETHEADSSRGRVRRPVSTASASDLRTPTSGEQAEL
ncbi:MAG: polysaccharide biosynthesis tyrosine autokinase [Planctomycetota bacterium]